MSPEILYEDENILAVNKPAGLVVHKDGRTKEPSVAEWLVEKYPEVKGVGEQTEDDRSGVVHRIDRETSGVLLLAKTKSGFDCLKEQFQNREIQKIYYTFVHGVMKETHGTISLPIGRSASDFRKFSASRGAKGEMREATTYFQVLKQTDDVALVEVRPKTGRTHQIRVHMSALQRPVVVDKLYGASKESILGFDRLALHAREIQFKDVSGEEHTVTAPFPQDFLNAFEAIGFVPKELP
jgi:23S rRNA pseudouridine1911/1915/1917 synthase